MSNIPNSKFILPKPAASLKAAVWSQLEAELATESTFNFNKFSKFIFGGLTTALIMVVFTTKFFINQAETNQFNDLDRELVLVEQTLSSEVANFEWEINSLESN